MSRALTDTEYLATTQVLEQLAGLVFDRSRRAALSAIVHERLDSTGRPDVSDYLAWVVTPLAGEERQLLLDAVTIQETHFFRNLPQIEALRHTVLPELLARAQAVGRPLTIWSAGCSTGEEPYTLAMVLLELMAGRPRVPVSIVGTDVSASALAVAREGVYSGRTIRLAEPGAAERWFEEVDDGSFSVRQEVRDLVEFRLHNLISDDPAFDVNAVDLVVCRNVTIYFTRETTRDLVHRFHHTMLPGGYLMLGYAETLWQVSEAFALVPVGEAFVYRKEAHSVRRGPGAPVLRVGGSAPSPAPPHRSLRRVLRPPVRLPRRATLAAGPVPAPMASPAADLAEARAELAAGRYDEAVALAQRAAVTDPLLVEAYVVHGRAAANLGDDVAAVAALRKAIFLDPLAGHAHFLLATTLTRTGDLAGASSAFAAAADTLPAATPERLGELLDGRAVEDLVDLCRQLAAGTGDGAFDQPPVEPAGRASR